MSQFFTNRLGDSLFKKFEGILLNNPELRCFNVIVGYLRASGYFKIQPYLQHMKSVRILVGIDTDKLLKEAHSKGLQYLVQPEEIKNEYLTFLKEDIKEAAYTQEVEQGILQFTQDVMNGKVELRAHPSKRIHAKVYIFLPENYTDTTLNAAVVTGSSNMTRSGLGFGNDEEQQYEFNVILHGHDDVQFAQNEFEALWAEASDEHITAQDLKGVIAGTHLNDGITPYEIYLKMLIEYFGDSVEHLTDDPFDMPNGLRKLAFQTEAVNEGYQKLLKYNGFFLSDVVGLGKTIVATMIAKRFIMANGYRDTRVLVIFPPQVERNWRDTFKKFGIDGNAKFLTNGRLNWLLDDEHSSEYGTASEYDLIIVDESHKFRNLTNQAYKLLQQICKTPRENIGKVAGRKKVMLISATPFNNRPKDILNQLLLFQDAHNSTLDGIVNLTAFFQPIEKRYEEIYRAYRGDSKKETVKAIKELFNSVRERVIKQVTVRRTRTDILHIERYRKDVESFPEVQPPVQLQYFMDAPLARLFNKTVNAIREGLTYARYQAIAHLKPEKRDLYPLAELSAFSLARIMETLLVKRMESSFFAFRQSLEKFRAANKNMIHMFENGKIYIAPKLDINKFYDAGLSDDEIEEEVLKAGEIDPTNAVFSPDDFVEGFFEKLLKDDGILNGLSRDWNRVKEDPKFDELLSFLSSRRFLCKDNVEGQLVIFTESADTASYLEEKLGRTDVLRVDSSNRQGLFYTIRNNFDANLELEKRQSDFKIIITTEVLAEGVNLHRSNFILHYDTPWNATKLMQRIGRVNRIRREDSPHVDKIFNFVFYPSAKGSELINLVQNSLQKLQAFHSAYGEDNQIFSTEEIVETDIIRLFQAGMQQEEVNPELKFLEVIRKIYDQDRTLYKRIASLPLKIRTGRAKRNAGEMQLQNSALVFIRNGAQVNFYLSDDTGCKSLSSLQALQCFEAAADEKRLPLVAHHHDWVNNAVNTFMNDAQQMIHEAKQPGKRSVQETNSLALLRSYIKNSSFFSEQELSDLKHLRLVIEDGILTEPAREISSLLRKKCSAEALRAKVLSIARKCNEVQSGDSGVRAPLSPTIILSETFQS